MVYAPEIKIIIVDSSKVFQLIIDILIEIVL